MSKRGDFERYRAGDPALMYRCGQCGNALPRAGMPCGICGSEKYAVSGHQINPWLKVFMQLLALAILWVLIRFLPIGN